MEAAALMAAPRAAAPRRRISALVRQLAHVSTHTRSAAAAAGGGGAIRIEGGRTVAPEEVRELAAVYRRDGFVHVRSVVPAAACAAACAALWRSMESDDAPIVAGDSSSWTREQWSGRVADRAVLDCWSAGHLQLVAAVAAGMELQGAAELGPARAACDPSLPPPAVIVRPDETMAINRFPARREQGAAGTPWEMPAPHIDHAGENWRAYPQRPVRVASMVFLSDAR